MEAAGQQVAPENNHNVVTRYNKRSWTELGREGDGLSCGNKEEKGQEGRERSFKTRCLALEEPAKES
jgi:hypothetical protein